MHTTTHIAHTASTIFFLYIDSRHTPLREGPRMGGSDSFRPIIMTPTAGLIIGAYIFNRANGQK